MHIFLYLLWLFPADASIDRNLAVDFFKAKSLTKGTIFSCDTKKRDLLLVKSLMVNRIYVSIFPTFEVDGELPLRDILHRDLHHLGIIADGDCEGTEKILRECGTLNLFDDTRHWLITTSHPNTSVQLFGNVSFNVNANVHVALNESNRTTIYDVYNQAYNHNGTLKITKLGTYTGENGYPYVNGSKYWLRKNMTGTTFKSAIVIPHLEGKLEDYLSSDEHREKDSMHRFQSVTVNYCRDMYNFTLHVQRTDSWGYKQSNGVFNGLVRLLELRKVDFGSSPLIFKLDRMPVVDYSFGNWILRSAFIYRRPKPQLYSFQVFLRPLDETVWILITVTLFIILFTLWVTFKFERTFELKRAVETTWSSIVMFVVASFCQQGTPTNPHFMSGKTVAMSLFVFTLIVYQFYSASIVSYLLMDPPRTIFNLRDLVHSSLKAGVEDIGIDRDYFVQTTDPYAIELYTHKIKHGNDSRFYVPEVGLQMVKRGGFAFHVETSTAYPIIEKTFTNQEICELEEVQMYRTQPMHTNLQKHSPFKEMLTYCMLRLVEDGLMIRLRKYWDARKPECIKSAKKMKISVGMGEFSFALIIFAVGLSTSVVLLAVEMLKEKIRKYRVPPKPIYPFVH